MKTKPKLRLYMQLKRKLEFEPYLTTEDAVGRARITALRGGTNPLRVEVGRRKLTSALSSRRLELDERKCLICADDVVEDETHFLLNCSLYSDERDEMLETVAEKRRIPMVRLRAAVQDEPIKVVQMLIGEGTSGAITAAVAEFCAGRFAWRDSVVKRYLDLGT